MRRLLLGALVLYLAADYCDPAIPGAFRFDSESFFVVAAVQQRGSVVAGGALMHALPVAAVDREETRRHQEPRPPSRATSRSEGTVLPLSARSGALPVKTPFEEH